jgi:hypothetical protein
VLASQAEWEVRMRGAMDDPGKDLDWDFAVTSFRAMVDHGERVMRAPAVRSQRARSVAAHQLLHPQSWSGV